MTRRIFKESILFKSAHKHFTHMAAQHDQLDRAGEVTPIVAILDNRWEENLPTDRSREEEKSQTLSLFKGLVSLREHAASILLFLPTHWAVPASPFTWLGCMYWTIADSHHTVTSAGKRAAFTHTNTT